MTGVWEIETKRDKKHDREREREVMTGVWERDRDKERQKALWQKAI